MVRSSWTQVTGGSPHRPGTLRAPRFGRAHASRRPQASAGGFWGGASAATQHRWRRREALRQITRQHRCHTLREPSWIRPLARGRSVAAHLSVSHRAASKPPGYDACHPRVVDNAAAGLQTGGERRAVKARSRSFAVAWQQAPSERTERTPDHGRCRFFGARNGERRDPHGSLASAG